MNFSTNLTSRNDAPQQQLSHRSRTAEATPTIDLTPPTQIVFIDRQLADYEVLAAGVLADIEVYLLDPGLDGIRQITQVLATRRSIDTIHLVSHGSAGSIQLGSADLSVESIDRYSQELQQWAARLAPDAVLSIYGCEVGKGDRGAALVYRLSELLGVSVAASETKTGSAALDGNWELEVRTGKQPVRLAFAADAIAAYEGVMATIDGTPGNDNLKGDNNLTAREDDTINGSGGDDTINGGLGIDTVNGGADSDTLIIDYSSQTFAGITSSIGAVGTGIYQGSLQAFTNGGGDFDRVRFFNIEKFQITGTKFNDNIDNLPIGSTIDAGLGIDTLQTADFSTLTSDVTVNEGGNLTFSDGTTLKNFERFITTTTGAGNDAVTLLGDYNKTIATGGGNDTINAGLGQNTVNGQADSDTLIIDYSSQTFAGITSSIGAVGTGIYQGSLQAFTNGGGDFDRVSFFNMEKFQITGTKFKDDIETGDADDTLTGGGGADDLLGGAGNDLYIVDRTKGGGTVIDDASGTNDTLTLVGGANFNASTDLLRSGTTLLVDLNKDGIFNAATDLSIRNYYATTTTAALGLGYIENINSLNLAPVGSPTATLANTLEDTAITINASDLLAGFSDPNGDILSVANLTATNGTLVNNNDGTYKFTPTTDYNGTVNLTYGVTDGIATLGGQTRSFSVTPATRIGVSTTTTNAAEPGTPGEFTLTRTFNTAAALTIDYTISGTATNGTDYQALTGKATFAAGETQAKVTIAPSDDTTAEGTETVILTLAAGTGYKLGTNTTGTLSLFDNETQPTISVNNVSQNEGDSGTTNFGFNLTLSTASTQTISVQYATADGTATAGSDYTAKTGTVTFNPGETSKMVDVGVSGDTTVESTETFRLNLSGAVNATLATSFGTGTIVNDDTIVIGGPIFLTPNADNYTATGADEVIYALAGNDIVNAGGGNDTIYGGAGVDLLYGGTGNDVFGFLNPTDGIDKIMDFVVGEDKIEIDLDGFGGASVFGTDSVGVLASSRFTLGTIATTASQRFIYNDRSGALFFDTDGVGGANQFRIAQLVGNPALSNNSFVLNTTSVSVG
jgi:Ca2+-binding RTX toxin-like protein